MHDALSGRLFARTIQLKLAQLENVFNHGCIAANLTVVVRYVH
jgi:hypothetical protein